jgi:hypothetical protein
MICIKAENPIGGSITACGTGNHADIVAAIASAIALAVVISIILSA